MSPHKKAEIIGNIYTKLRDEINGKDFSEDFITSLLKEGELELNDEVVQERLQSFHDRGFIELKRENAVYLRILLSGFDVAMLSIKRLLIRVKDEASKYHKFTKTGIDGYLKTVNLSIDDERVQETFTRWHQEGFIDLIKEDKDYLRVLKGGMDWNNS